MKHLRTMNRIAIGMALALLATSSFAQDAHALLERMSAQARTYTSVRASYTSLLVDKANDLEIAGAGTIDIVGEQYHLDLGDYVVISNGETVWTYERGINECYVDDAEELAADGMDPAKLFTIWEDDFRSEQRGRHPTDRSSRVRIRRRSQIEVLIRRYTPLTTCARQVP